MKGGRIKLSMYFEVVTSYARILTPMEKENTPKVTKTNPEGDAIPEPAEEMDDVVMSEDSSDNGNLPTEDEDPESLRGAQTGPKEGAEPPVRPSIGTTERQREESGKGCSRKKRLSGATSRHLQALIKGAMTFGEPHKGVMAARAASEMAKPRLAPNRLNLTTPRPLAPAIRLLV
uniref:Uncharacterized protein n=1 Tax=Glossina austeni TaxID=7395 RepID=A0A1A9V284_GLOAU